MEVSGIRFPPGSKSISTDMNPAEIVKSLKRCCKFFSQLEQDQEEEKSMYLPFCLYIAESDLIHEITDVSARIHLGCIFADIFRLHAPENPFPAEKTKEIFLFLTEQLAHLKNSKSPQFSKAYHILENVSVVKSFNSCLELDSESANEVFSELFKVIFSSVNLSHDAQLKAHMLDMMTCILSESDSLSPSLLNSVLLCLLEKNSKMNPSAYELARELLRKTVHYVEGFVMLFFQNAMLGEQRETNLLHYWPQLFLELHKISDVFLTNAVPQLELRLRTDDMNERLQVVRLLARMFSEKDSCLFSKYPSLWQCFLTRFNDIEPQVRIECVNFCSEMILNHGDGARGREVVAKLIDLLKLRRHDTDEGVRAAVVVTIRAIGMQNLSLVSDELLVFLRERLLDKKHKVRDTAIRAVADVCKLLSASPTSSHIYSHKLGMLQSQLLRAYYTQDFEACVLIERIFVSSLVQYSLPSAERIKRLLRLYCTVDSHAIRAVAEMLKKQKTLRDALRVIVNALDLEDEEANKQIWPKVMVISSQLQAPMQAREHVKKLISILRKESVIRQWLQYLVSEQYTCQKVALAVRDILKKLESDGIAKAVRRTIQQLLEKAVLLTVLIDSSSLMALTELVRSMLDGTVESKDAGNMSVKTRGMDLLHVLADHDPNLFAETGCFEVVIAMLKNKEEYVVDKSLLILLSTSHIIEKSFTSIRTVLLPELKSIAKAGTPRQSKYAIQCLSSFVSVREAPLMQVFHECKALANEETPSSLKLQTALTALGCIAECLPKRAGRELKGFVASVVVKKIIMRTKKKTSKKKKDIKWCEKTDVSEETSTKLVALKCMTRWLCGLNSNELDCCGSALRLLQHMMHNNGDLMKCGYILKAEMAHLRLQAAFCVLRIAKCDAYRDLISTSVSLELSVLLSDEVREVRQLLLAKLYRSLFSFQVHISFMSLFWVISQEKVKECRDHGATLYHQLIKRYRTLSMENHINPQHRHSVMPEYAISFTIHLLANDPDIPLKEDVPKSVLSRTKESLNFMLDPLLTRDNPESFGFIKRLAEMIKRTKLQEDSQNSMRNKILYKVCDLVLQLILVKSAQYAIGIVEPPDDAVRKFLPPSLYTKLDEAENLQNYLPEDFQIEPKFAPFRVASSGKSKPKDKALSSVERTTKIPQKITVAVTKVPLSSSSEIRDIAGKSTLSPTRLGTTRPKQSQNKSKGWSSKRPPSESCSSDEETLASKKTKLGNTENRQKESPEVGGLEENDKSPKASQSPKISEPTLHSNSPSLSPDKTPSRPKRSSAGSKMFEYLRSAKRTPTKSKVT